MTTFKDFFLQVPTLSQQLTLIFIMIVFWAAVDQIAMYIVNPIVKDKAWLKVRMEREYKAYKKSCEDLGFTITLEQVLSARTPQWVCWLTMLFQHYIAFFLCLPGIFGWCEPTLGRALVTFAGNSEIGWEWQEYPQRLYRYFGKKDGHLHEMPVLLLLYGMHHCFGLAFLPLVLNYYDEYYFWTMICVNHLAAAQASTATEYTYFLDVTKKSDLWKMRILNLITTIFNIWARFFYFIWNAYNLMLIFYQRNDIKMLWFGGVILVIFLFFNITAVLKTFILRTIKFFKMEAHDEDRKFVELSEEAELNPNHQKDE